MTVQRPGGPAQASAAHSTGGQTNGQGLEALAAALAPLLAEQIAAVVQPVPATPEGALLDAEGAAALLGVPGSWVLAEARADRIPHVRLGRYVRFDADELRAWTAERGRGPRRRTSTQPVSGRGQGR